MNSDFTLKPIFIEASVAGMDWGNWFKGEPVSINLATIASIDEVEADVAPPRGILGRRSESDTFTFLRSQAGDTALVDMPKADFLKKYAVSAKP